MSKGRDWHRLNPSWDETKDIEIDRNSHTMRARKKGHEWEYRQYYDIRHAEWLGNNIVYEQEKRKAGYAEPPYSIHFEND